MSTPRGAGRAVTHSSAPGDRNLGRAELPLLAGVSREQMAAFVNTHSGLPEIALQEWAILLRCKGARPAALDELVESLLQWFEQPLSAPEITGFLDRLTRQGWLARHGQGRAWQTTPLGEEVLAQTERPLLKGTAWRLMGAGPQGDKP